MDHIHDSPAAFGRIGLSRRHADVLYGHLQEPMIAARHAALWLAPLIAILSVLMLGLPAWMPADFGAVNVLGAAVLLSASYAFAGVAVYAVAAYGPAFARRQLVAKSLWNAAVAPRFGLGFGREDRARRRSRRQIARLNQDMPTDLLLQSIARERLFGWTAAAFMALTIGLVLARL